MLNSQQQPKVFQTTDQTANGYDLTLCDSFYQTRSSKLFKLILLNSQITSHIICKWKILFF